MNNSYRAYPKNKPNKDDVYLISISNDRAVRMGVAGHGILIARYNASEEKWFPIMGTNPESLFDITEDVVAWRDLPKP